MADLYSKFNEIQKRLQGNNVTIIQARTILLGFQVNLGLFKSSLARRDLKYFANLRQLQGDENISDDDLEICIRLLEKLRKNFRVRCQDLEKLHIPEWILTPFDLETENANITSDVLIEISKQNHCSEANASVNTGEMRMLLLNTPGLVQQLSHLYSHSQVRTWLKLVLVTLGTA